MNPDLAAVHRNQDQYSLTPLSAWPGPASVTSTPPVAAASPLPPPGQVAALTGREFFAKLSELMRGNPAAPRDAPAQHRFKEIGFVPGEVFNPPAHLRDAVNAAPAEALRRIGNGKLGDLVHGWWLALEDIGTYGSDYMSMVRQTLGLRRPLRTRWLTRRVLAVLWFPWLVSLSLTLTNDAHHPIWTDFSFDGSVRQVRGIAHWILFGYGFLLAMAVPLVFVWLFRRSPPHRRSAALCLGGQVVTRVAYLPGVSDANPLPMDPTPFAIPFTAAAYALALFRFRMLDLIPIARGTMVEQMREGMLVLDARERIVDWNPAARVRGGHAAQVLAVYPDLKARIEDRATPQSEVSLAAGGATRHQPLHLSPLKDRRGFLLGYLLLLQDVTEQKQTRAQILEQQRALATLQERNRVARQLHDSLGQVLGCLKMQAEVAQAFLAQDQASEANRRLSRLVAAAQDAQADVREYILGARAGISAAAFLPTLKHYLRRFSENYGIATNLHVSPELKDRVFDPMVEAQLLRIIQEALTNVRKHAGARGVEIRLGVSDSRAEAIVQDHGAGFDPALLESAAGQKFRLRFMRERAEEVGGVVNVHSAPGRGTRVAICVPLRKGPPAV